MIKYRVVIDTNVLLSIIPKKSNIRSIYDSIISGDTTLVLCNDILNEYSEILQQKTNNIIEHNVINLLLFLPNVELHNVYFKWNLIEDDPDDNKFVDCAISGSADFIITYDKHFNILKELDFPKTNIISPIEFIRLIN